jgi:hypothetical protein
MSWKTSVTRMATIAMAAFCTAAVQGATPTVNFGITGAGPNNLGGVYTDPYQISAGGDTSILGFCDDFTDNVYPPQYWTALATNLSEIPTNPTTVFFGDGIIDGNHYTQLTRYIAAAIIATDSLVHLADVTRANDDSYALWAVFYPVLLTDAYQASCTEGCFGGSDLVAARAELQSALTAATGYVSGAAYEAATGTDVMVYSATTDGSTPSSAPNRPQEFITVRMAEAPSPALLAMDFSAVAGLALFFRRRRKV